MYVVETEAVEDERGLFARTWCATEFAARGLNPALSQCSVSVNRRRGTLRGMHYQAAPHGEAKLVRVTRGAIHDVALDLRPESPTFLHSFGVVLTASNHTMLYVPEGCAHGFLTLEDDTEVLYQISTAYIPEAARGVRFDDPSFEISWPDTVTVIAPRDRDYPDFSPVAGRS